MPKRPKPKVRTNASTGKVVSPAKQRRIDKQALQEEFNRTHNNPYNWIVKKAHRHNARILLGKHEQWLTKKAREKQRPSASNTLVK